MQRWADLTAIRLNYSENEPGLETVPDHFIERATVCTDLQDALPLITHLLGQETAVTLEIMISTGIFFEDS